MSTISTSLGDTITNTTVLADIHTEKCEKNITLGGIKFQK